MRFSLLAFVLVIVALPVAAQTTHTVTVRNFEFDPATLSIETGDTVRWVNEAGTHNVNQLTGPESFGSGTPASAPWEYAYTFTQVGTSTYDCAVHPDMQGTVSVTQNTSGEEPLSFRPDGLEHAGENPFRETARFILRLSEPGEVRVSVYDARGRELAVLFEGTALTGTTPLEWSPSGDASAVYVVRAGGAVRSSLGVARIGTTPSGH